MFQALSDRSLSLCIAVALSGVLLLSSNAQRSNTQVEEHFQKAQQAQQQGSFDIAAREYEAALRLQPDLPEAYVNLGLVYYAEARFSDSAKSLANAAKLRPGMRGVSLWLGIDYVRLHRPGQAVTLLRDAVRLDPADKVAQSWLGTALWDAGQIDAALLQLRKANAQFPGDPDLLFALGEAYGKAAGQQTDQLLEETSGSAFSDLIYGTTYAGEQEWTKAEGHLRRAIARDPHLLDARLELADVLLSQAKLPAAQEQLDEALSQNPRSATALALSGELLLLVRQPAEGLSRIESALEIDRSETLFALGLPVEENGNTNEPATDLLPLGREAAASLETNSDSSPAKNVALAALYELAGNKDGALRALPAVASKPPSSSHSRNLFVEARVAIHQHRYEDAEDSLLRWIAAHPGDLTARYDLALSRRKISIQQLSHLLAIAPDSYHVHQMLGQLYVSREEDEKAMPEYLAVSAARPDLPDVHFWLGHLYWKHGDAEHALVEFKRELELSPGHPEANGELGAILVAEEHVEEAIPHLESAIQSKPDLWPAYSQLGRAYATQKKYTRAEDVLKRALAHDQDGSTHYQLGLVLRAEGKTAQAARAFAQVRAIKNEAMAAPSTDDAAIGGAKP